MRPTATSPDFRATLPAPALLGERMWDPVKSAAAYPTRDDFVRACVPILRREVELLRDEGLSIIQIDDPHLFRYGYESDGKTFMVKAVGDLDCDGIEIAYVMTGTVDAQGNVSTTVVPPAPNTD